ncbi:MAG: hypothetical protein JSS97_09755 [Actinobacteria bacterium]|nr:hypothetical protein [Actinomycetota bacterium]
MRLFKALTFILVVVVLVGVVVLIVVEIADYHGRTPTEKLASKHGYALTSLSRCPKDPLRGREGEHHPGTAGDMVPHGPTSALLCDWSQAFIRGEGSRFVLGERIVKRGADLIKLVGALNSLPPATPLPPGEYACPEAEPYDVLVGLRYGGSSEVHVEVGPGFCGGYSALNLQDKTEYVATTRLIRLLDGLLRTGS